MLRAIDLADPIKLRSLHVANRDHPLAAQRMAAKLRPRASLRPPQLARLEPAADSFSGLLGGNLATEREL
jgi:hypothetical protein